MISPEARAVIESGRLAHMVTVNPDGSPQVSCVWVGVDGDDIVMASLGPRRKLSNLERDPRVAVSIETDEKDRLGLTRYLVVQGRARLQVGGAAELLQRLAGVYLGPGVKFPPGDEHPPGVVVRITAERVSGNGPWAAG